MIRARFSWIIASVALLAFAPLTQAVPATQPSTPASAAPTTQPADIALLIRQLGDDDFHVRATASRQLKAIGKSALPALEEARKTPDIEVHTRIEEIIADLTRPPVDESAVPQPGPVQPNRSSYSSRMSINNGSRTIDTVEPGRTVHIEEKPDGIYMKVTGQLDGKEVTREYKAKSADLLKKEHPAAFALYQQKSGNGINIVGARGNNMINVRIQVNGNAVAIGPGAAPANVQELMKANRLQVRLMNVMREKQIPDAHQREVLDLLTKLRHGIPDLQKTGKEKEAADQEFAKLGDAVRAKIDELKLGDFDSMLPPKPEKAPEKAKE